MGNDYSMICRDCKEFYYMAKEMEWVTNREMVYCLQDFLQDHRTHSMGYSGDQWNIDSSFSLDTSEWKSWDASTSKLDFKEKEKNVSN